MLTPRLILWTASMSLAMAHAAFVPQKHALGSSFIKLSSTTRLSMATPPRSRSSFVPLGEPDDYLSSERAVDSRLEWVVPIPPPSPTPIISNVPLDVQNTGAMSNVMSTNNDYSGGMDGVEIGGDIRRVATTSSPNDNPIVTFASTQPQPPPPMPPMTMPPPPPPQAVQQQADMVYAQQQQAAQQAAYIQSQSMFPQALPGAWSTQLLNFLDDVEPLGTFATAGIIDNMPFPYPIVTVEGVGRLSFPIMDVAVKPLKQVATLSSYNKVTEADPAKVKLGGGPMWDECLNNIMRRACRELGFSNERLDDLGVVANFWKLLLYDSGGYATTQRDSKKEDGMFGTLVIQLPSKFSSGTLSIRSTDGGGREGTKIVNVADQSEDKFKYIASYTNCEHGLSSVTSGNRLCLVFNLVATKLPAPAVPSMKAYRPLKIGGSGSAQTGTYAGGIPFVHPPITIERVKNTALSGAGASPYLQLPMAAGTVAGSNRRPPSATDGATFQMLMGNGNSQEWEECLQRIVHQACRLLGFTDERFENLGIRADLHKMLLYQNTEHIASQYGGMSDSDEKESGMFGTLIVQVPSRSTEGEVTVVYQGLSKKFRLVDSTWKSKVAAGSSFDLPMCLVFHLVRPKKTQMPGHASNVEIELSLQALVNEWQQQLSSSGSGGFTARLGYQLGHQYKPSEFSVANLKGHDAIVFQTLRDAKNQSGNSPLFDVHLLLMERYIKKNVDDYVEDDTRARKVLDRNGMPVQDLRDWTMFKRADGWLVNRDEFCSLEDNADTDECDDDIIDEAGNPVNTNHKMFHGINEERVELDWGSMGASGAMGSSAITMKGAAEPASSKEQWYYAAAIVVSPKRG